MSSHHHPSSHQYTRFKPRMSRRLRKEICIFADNPAIAANYRPLPGFDCATNIKKNEDHAFFAECLLQMAGFVIFLPTGRREMDFPERITISRHTIEIVPRYVETDKAGMVHHSVYPVWLEMGRTELLRANGLAYKDLEAEGVFFVVAEMHIKYRRPALYDEKLQLETICSNVTPGKVEHAYRLIRPADATLLAEATLLTEAARLAEATLLAEARTILACVSAEGKVRRVPKFMFPE